MKNWYIHKHNISTDIGFYHIKLVTCKITKLHRPTPCMRINPGIVRIPASFKLIVESAHKHLQSLFPWSTHHALSFPHHQPVGSSWKIPNPNFYGVQTNMFFFRYYIYYLGFIFVFNFKFFLSKWIFTDNYELQFLWF